MIAPNRIDGLSLHQRLLRALPLRRFKHGRGESHQTFAFRLLGLLCALAFCPTFPLKAGETAAASKPVDLTELPIEALMNLEVPSVYAASKVEQKTTDAPSSVTILTSDDIKRYGYRTLGDALRSVPGLNVSYDRNYAFLGARGVSLGDFNDRMLVLVDGHRINNNYNDGAAIGTDFILDIDLVDRIEVIRGPGSVLYGNNAFFGVINVITRQPGQVNGAEGSFDYGKFDTYKGRLTIGQQFTNGLRFLLSGSYYDSQGADQLFYKEFATPAQNFGIADQMDADSAGSVLGSVGYGDFSLEAALNRREKVNPTAQFSTTFNDPDLRTIDERGYATFNYAHSFPDVADVTARVYYDQFTHEIGYPFGTTLFTENDKGEWWGTELQLTRRFWDRHVITIGAEYRDDFQQDSRIFDQTTTYSNLKTNRQSYGAYAQGDFAVLTNLHLIGGLRYDQYGDFDPSLNPRVALIYHAWESSTFKTIYGTAFRAPSFYEVSTSSHPLTPEEITSYEFVYEQGIGHHLRSSLSVFYNHMDNLIVFDSGSFTNFDASTTGMELALEGSWANGIRGRASYSFQDTRNTSVPWDMPDSPNHMLKFNVSVPLYKDKIFASAEVLFNSARKSLHNATDINGQPITVQGEDAASYGILNLTLFSQNLIRNLEFSASVYNVLDRRFSDPASNFHTQDIIEQDGRSFRVKLTCRF